MTAEIAWALIDKKTGNIAYRYDFAGNQGVVVCNLDGACKATHWMPLPEAPNAMLAAVPEYKE